MPSHQKKSIGKWLSRFLLMCACLLSMSACTTPPLNKPNVPYQENLKIKCQENDLPRLTGTQGTAAAEALNAWPEIYGQCAARHNQLIDEINKREEINNGE